MNTKVENLEKQANLFGRTLRSHASTIATNLLCGKGMYNEEIDLVKAASYHVTMFEGIFREEFKKAVIKDPSDNMDMQYIMYKILDAVKIFDKGNEFLFSPTGKLKEGETLGYKLFSIK